MTTGQDMTMGDDRSGPPELVHTKLLPPAMRHETIRRTGLLAALDAAWASPLVLVAAPAGYGKTTLLGDWAADRGGRPTAWVTLDEADNDPVVLWSHIVAALKRASPGLDVSVGPEAASPGLLTAVVLPRLVNALTELAEPTLVLDDYHRLSPEVSRDSVTWFLRHAPTSLHVVIATRTEPRLPLGAMRAHGELAELRSDVLRFTVAEAGALLNDRLGLEVGEEDLTALVSRTEGWPAGLYLAALSMSGIEDKHEFVTRFNASNRHLVDFLIDDVLDTFDRPTQEFMLRTGVLARMCGPLCDEVTEHPGSTERLGQLARTNLFLVPLDDRGEWYRFHHLFAQLLLLELKRRDPDLVPVLHRRAALWHGRHGTLAEAVGHSLDGAALETAAELIEGSWIDVTNASQFETLRGWLSRFPERELNSDVRLLLVRAWVLSLCGRRQEAARAITRLESRDDLATGPLPDGFASGESSLTTLKSIFPWGDVGAQLATAKRAAELEPPDSRWYPLARYALGLASYFRGDFADGETALGDAHLLALEAGQWLVAGSAQAYRSLAAGESGRPSEQRWLAEEAATFAAEYGMEDVAGEVHVALGVSLASQGRAEDAWPLLERGVLVLRSWAQPTELAEALVRLAPVLQSLGEMDRADAVVSEARAVIDGCPDPGDLPRRVARLEGALAPGLLRAAAVLTDRELEVLRFLAGPASRREIAASLFVSLNTVRSQVRAIYLKLGVNSRTAAVDRGRVLGLI